MRFLPRFREERILREQVALVYQNYTSGFLGYFFTTLIATVVLSIVSEAKGIFYWLAASALVAFLPLIRQQLKKDRETVPRQEAIEQVWSLFFAGVVWGMLPLIYFDGDSTTVMVLIAALGAGVTAGGLSMQSPCLPVFIAFAYTSLPAMGIAFLMLGGVVYDSLALATIVYLAVMTKFASNLEAMTQQSIELRFDNLDLIEQLQTAMVETEEANQAKSVFLASASHDLRQPLHAMGLFIQTLRGTKLDAYQQNVIKHIELSSEATREMLNTLLDFSKLEAGVIEPRNRAFRVQRLFNKLEQELGASADSKKLIYRTRETSTAAFADMALVELILRNLITNAIRYTETGGVLIGCRNKGDRMLVIEVWDTGIGVPKQEHENIFREFHQIGNPERDRQKGFGLGLAIARGLADTMELSLTIKSRLDRGSVFRLELPEAEASVLDDVPENQAVLRFDNKRILIIDDDESVRLGMRELLLSWGCQCLLAESAEEALALIDGESLDLLIVDYRLREERTGREAIKLVREKYATELPAIIITGDTAADRLREAQASDALLLHKPVATTELQRTMTTLLLG